MAVIPTLLAVFTPHHNLELWFQITIHSRMDAPAVFPPLK